MTEMHKRKVPEKPMFIKKHPLTDEMIREMLEEDFSENYDEGYVAWVTGGMRAAYDLAWKNAKDQDKVYIRQSYNQGYNDAKKEINCVLSQTRELEEL